MRGVIRAFFLLAATRTPMPCYPANARIKVQYLLTYSVYGTALPFLPLLLKMGGLGEVGLVFAVSAMGLAALVSPVVLAGLADRRLPAHRLMFGALAGTAGAIWLFSGALSPLWAFFATWCLYLTFLPAPSLLDSIALRRLTGSDSPGFHKFRIWGSIGFMAPTAILWLYPPEAIAPREILTLLSILAAIAALHGLLVPTERGGISIARSPSLTAFQAAIRPPLRSIMGPALCAGIGMSVFYALFPVYLDALNVSVRGVGLIINLGVLWEIVMMPFTGRLITRFGTHSVIALGFFAISIRLLLLSAFPGPLTALLTTPLHGPLVIGFFVAVPAMLARWSVPGAHYSLQGLYTAIVIGVGRLLGPLALSIIFLAVPLAPHERLRFAFIIAALFIIGGGFWFWSAVKQAACRSPSNSLL